MPAVVTSRLSRARRLLSLAILILPALCACHGHSDLRTVVRRDAARRNIAKADRFIATGELVEAKQNLDKAVEYDPRSSDAHSRLALIAEKQNDLPGAVEHHRTAFKLNPDSFDNAFALAECQYRLAQTSLDRKRLLFSAARAYRHAQSLDTTNPAPTLRLAACYREQGEINLALDTLKETFKQNPALPEIQRELASLYAQQEKYDEACEFYLSALKSNPDDVSTLNGLAGIEMTQLSKLGGTRAAYVRCQAVNHLRRSLQINPQQPEIEAHLRRLTPYEWRAVKVREAE